jgi:hypothetical protein
MPAGSTKSLASALDDRGYERKRMKGKKGFTKIVIKETSTE